MKARHSFLSCGIAVLFIISGCSATGGDIVKITNVDAAQEPLSGLKASDRAMLEEIKKDSAGKDSPDNVTGSLMSTKARHLTVAEYMQLHPDADGKGSRDYIVGGNDLLSIAVYEEKDFSGA